MTKARESTKAIGGPYLDAALVCEMVLEDTDKAFSAIRMVNRITLYEATPASGAIISLPLAVVLSFKAGDSRGKHELFLYLTNPSSKRELLPGFDFPQHLAFQGGDTGHLLALPLLIRYERDGTYWIDVVLGRKRYSRIPLTVKTTKEPPDPLPVAET